MAPLRSNGWSAGKSAPTRARIVDATRRRNTEDMSWAKRNCRYRPCCVLSAIAGRGITWTWGAAYMRARSCAHCRYIPSGSEMAIHGIFAHPPQPIEARTTKRSPIERWSSRTMPSISWVQLNKGTVSKRVRD
eukprot:scaffold201358_cov26-Tisochrysis_lutea.AAC.3